MHERYVGLFDSRAGVLDQFEAPYDALDGAEVLMAYYCYEGYSGTAMVVFRKGDQLFEVNGSHCSCYGLEGQWEPEVTSKEALAKRDPYDPTLSDLLSELVSTL